MESKHIVFFFLFTLAAFITASNSKSIIKRLPGFDGDLPFTLETGYIGVGEDEAVQIFYYFVESERNPSEDPLLIYLTGGPGTSVLYSMMYQIGPLNFDTETSWGNNITLKLNPYSWSKIANVIYIDAPAGAGFAYATTYEASMSSDSMLASDAYDFLRKWFLEHPEFLSNPLYISGISYMGIILPNVALHVYNGNERGDQPQMNIKGVISVSPLTDKFGDFNSRFEFAHRLSLISDDIYESTKETCVGNYLSIYDHSDNILCSNNLQWVDECTSKINLENILEPLCDPTDPACREATFGLVVIWANNKEVQKALNVREGTIGTWEWQNSTIHYDLGKNDTLIYAYDVFSTVPMHKQLLAKKCQYLIICGDHDMVFPHVGTEAWIRSLNLPVEKRWEPWFVNDQIAGYQVTYAQNDYLLTYSTIKGAGHGIALYKPEEALAMAPAKLARRQLREKRRETRAADLVKKDDDIIIKLENAAIERSKSVDSAVLGKYSIWRKENDNDNTDTTVRLVRDQIIMARVYKSIAMMKNNTKLARELQNQIKESHRALGDAAADADLNRSVPERIKIMGQVLSKAKNEVYDCKLVTGKLRAMLQSADEQVRSLKKQSTFLSQLAAKTIPNGIHCLSMRLTIDYYLLPPEKRKFPRSENLENPNLYHYALFSDNVLAASVVVNSTIINAKEPEKHVFHLVSDKLNFGAMNMWFLLNPPGKSTIHVENVDEFKWLNSSYCPVLRQLESSAMKEYYFKSDHQTTLSAGSSNLKYRNPKYLSMLNHLRFYLPQVYPKLNKILFLDDDIVVQKDLTGLWRVDLKGNVNGAVETCGESFHRFDKYLNFSNPNIARNFDPNACGWAYGMNVFDLDVWKKKDITGIYHRWQNMNEDRVLWKLGTLPPGLMTFYGLTQPLDKSWHVLGLGYNPSIDKNDIDKAAVIHYNGNMKPWLELAMTRYRSYWIKYIKFDHPYIRGCKLGQ